MDLDDTGIYDAQYLAGLIADETKMSRKDLCAARERELRNAVRIRRRVGDWARKALTEWRWLESGLIPRKRPPLKLDGRTLSSVVAITDDSKLNLAEIKQLLARVEKTIHQQPNDVRSAMNGFVIAVGSYVVPLTDLAIQTGRKNGPVSVDVGNTACKIPFSPDYIQKVQKRGTIGKKCKTARC